jgi:hypothetical protein
MSRVFSFRLRDDNPREVQAEEVIEAWISQGYSLRHILTEALIQYGNGSSHSEEMADLIEQLRDLLKQTASKQIVGDNSVDNKSPLSSHFIDAVKKSIKPGATIV